MAELQFKHTIVGKISCMKCGCFMGILTSDGAGPCVDDCPGGESVCPMKVALKQFEPDGRAARIKAFEATNSF